MRIRVHEAIEAAMRFVTANRVPVYSAACCDLCADLHATGQIPQYQEVVDTIIAGKKKSWPTTPPKQVSNGLLEGINNLP